MTPFPRYLMTHHDPTSPALASNLYRLAYDRGVRSSLLQSVASHGDDIVLIFRFNRNRVQSTTRDLQMAALLTEMWTNFVKSGLIAISLTVFYLISFAIVLQSTRYLKLNYFRFFHS